VLLALLELPVTSEPLLVEIVVSAAGLLVMWQAFRAGQYLLATGFLPLRDGAIITVHPESVLCQY